MIEDLLKNELFLKYFPPLAGLFFLCVFVSLGLWQLDRAHEKDALLAQFDNDSAYVAPANFDALREFDRIQLFGHYLGARQILIDNILQDGRLGYLVITPFEPSTNEPLLLVNRGWVAKVDEPGAMPELSVDTDFKTIRGLVGHLPRVAIRPGARFGRHRAEWRYCRHRLRHTPFCRSGIQDLPGRW